MKFSRLTRPLPDWRNAALAVLSAILLVLAFPDFEISFLASVGLVPLLCAIDREKGSTARSLVLGWLWGLIFFTGTCWWLTYAPITYAGFPTWLAFFLLLLLTAAVGIFPGIFSALMSVLLRRLGAFAVFAAPFVWVFTEFLRYWLTGNNWNAIGYSQFNSPKTVAAAAIGGVLLCSAAVVVVNSTIGFAIIGFRRFMDDPKTAPAYTVALFQVFGWFALLNGSVRRELKKPENVDVRLPIIAFIVLPFVLAIIWAIIITPGSGRGKYVSQIVAVQPNVPMSGLDEAKWRQLRQRHVELTESALSQLPKDQRLPTTVVFPESPMNFMWEEDEEFRNFVKPFAARHNVQVLFNSAEPDPPNRKYFNSAVLIGPDGTEIAQYDKIFLLPFGESVPSPLQAIVPAFVGSFSYGREFDLLPIGDAKAGVMICFESHFGELSREYVRNGADLIIEMTNDGYLGPTPVLRQHLANAVFRAVETNRPVIRTTNVGITAYISERGEIRDAAEPFTEATRVWPVAKFDGSQTFYVRYGDWFAWLCSIVAVGLLTWALIRRKGESAMPANSQRPTV